MKITVFGLGYVGATSAVLLSNSSEVYAVDTDTRKIDIMNHGLPAINDSAMKTLMERGNLSLTATGDAEAAIINAEYIIIAIPTNYVEEKESFDMAGVEQLTERIVSSGSRATVVIRSTAGIGYTEKLKKSYPDHDFLYVPEFLREKSAMEDAMHPDRIVIGYDLNDPRARERAETFSEVMLTSIKACTPGAVPPPTLFMSWAEAEAVKLFSNAYLAMRVSFFNELDTFSEIIGMRTARVIRGVSLDKRIGNNYNRPSFGYGGYCLPKDTKMLNSCFSDSVLLHSVPEANAERKHFIAERIMTRARYLQGNSTNPLIGFYHLSEIPTAGNLRGSTMLDILRILQKEKFRIMIYEPLLKDISELHGLKPAESEDPASAAVVLENDLQKFKEACDLIAANRFDENLADVKEKVYTRDINNRA